MAITILALSPRLSCISILPAHLCLLVGASSGMGEQVAEDVDELVGSSVVQAGPA